MEHPVGTLNVKVVRVMNLKKTLLFLDRECFVKVGLTKDSLPFKKSNMIKSSNPECNEEFHLVVKDLNVQALEISVLEGQLAKKSFDPVWNEEVIFSFEKPPTNEIMNLELHSSSQISKFCQVTKRGHVNISLANIMKKTRTKEMYHLEDTSGGRLHAELQWRTSFS
ncbi:synaptotagmin-1 [Artemisia annua]|uniref:Synaptotagmin-1 n=1 Tax=Artemisia annua TaxID=35608 RepID=A0A2U1LD58_ARTAN|nr:synaptotagmin-1 [Artemisia annua]